MAREPLDPRETMDELKASKKRVEARTNDAMDQQELREREQAAQAYSTENEQYLVDFINDCTKTANDHTIDIRRRQMELYRVYQEEEPYTYRRKSAWQSRTVVPRPYESVQYGAAAVKKAFARLFCTTA